MSTEKGSPPSKESAKAFDYIVIGGGTAGLAIAKRLAEDPNVSVVVVEAGRYHQIVAPFVHSIPGADVLFVGASERTPNTDWGFRTTPDPASGNKKRYYAQGKCLGGR